MSDKLQMMLEDAKELNALGLMSDSEVDAIAVMVKAREVSARIAKVKSMTGEEIKAIRTRYGHVTIRAGTYNGNVKRKCLEMGT
ncbi:putative regulatory protein [Escherichia coli]|nr:putative regulatory protein [Escherichia coli]